MFRAAVLSITIAATAAVAACGGKSAPATTSATTEPAGNRGEDHEHHFPAEMSAFHDKLAPLWHADSGQPRVDATCAATGELDALAASVRDAAPPAGVDAATWSERGTALVDSITKLSAACGSPDRATFEPDFHAVHGAFHGLIELLPATAADEAAH